MVHPRCIAFVLVPSALLVIASPRAQADISFDDVSGDRGLLPYTMFGMGGGAIAADYDDDGDIDVFVPNAVGIPDQLYRNLGDGSFEEIAADVGLDSLDGPSAAVWFDYDGDHDLDLAVGGDCWETAIGLDPCTDMIKLRLYRQNADGMFEDVTVAAGLPVWWGGLITSVRGSLIAGDINNDGWLDLHVGMWSGQQGELYLNNQDGTFTDITMTSGIAPGAGVQDDHWQSMFYDFDGDGWLDLFVCIDFNENHLYINQQDNTFVDMAADAGVDSAWNEMGMTLGDYDNDGDMDIYITNIFSGPAQRHNALFRNDSAGDTLSFTEVAQDLGCDQGYWGWGTTFLDSNNDGWLDIAATNGWTGTWLTDPSVFYLSSGGPDVTFSESSVEVGFDDTYWGSGLVAFDLERDGDLDLFQTCIWGGPTRLLESSLNGADVDNHYLVIKPRMDGPNHRAIGATVRVSAGGLDMMRYISAGTSFLSQEPAEAFFGLGAAAIADSVTIEWPDGTETTWTNVVADRVRTLVPGGVPEDLDMDGDVDFTDIVIVLSSWGPCPLKGPCPADYDGLLGVPDGEVGFLDLLRVLAAWNP